MQQFNAGRTTEIGLLQNAKPFTNETQQRLLLRKSSVLC
jgi:hypothetical protein